MAVIISESCTPFTSGIAMSVSNKSMGASYSSCINKASSGCDAQSTFSSISSSIAAVMRKRSGSSSTIRTVYPCIFKLFGSVRHPSIVRISSWFSLCGKYKSNCVPFSGEDFTKICPSSCFTNPKTTDRPSPDWLCVLSVV